MDTTITYSKYFPMSFRKSYNKTLQPHNNKNANVDLSSKMDIIDHHKSSEYKFFTLCFERPINVLKYFKQ